MLSDWKKASAEGGGEGKGIRSPVAMVASRFMPAQSPSHRICQKPVSSGTGTGTDAADAGKTEVASTIKP